MKKIISVGDIIVYRGQRMKVKAYVSGSRVRAVTMHGKPTRMEISVNDKRLQKVTVVRTVYSNDASEIDESEIGGDEDGNPAIELDQRGEIE